MNHVQKIHNVIVQIECNVYNSMYNVQIILAHYKQTHCQPTFLKNMDSQKN
jgi:hypothetical protein